MANYIGLSKKVQSLAPFAQNGPIKYFNTYFCLLSGLSFK
jgi:hypothetical protein